MLYMAQTSRRGMCGVVRGVVEDVVVKVRDTYSSSGAHRTLGGIFPIQAAIGGFKLRIMIKQLVQSESHGNKKQSRKGLNVRQHSWFSCVKRQPTIGSEVDLANQWYRY